MEQPQTDRNRPRGRRYLRVPEVAAKLRISQSTAYDLIAKRELPAHQLRPRGTVLVDEAELEAWVGGDAA